MPESLHSRAAQLAAAAEVHLSNPVLRTFGVAQLLRDLLTLVADIAAAVDAEGRGNGEN